MKKYIELFLHILVLFCLLIYLEERVASHEWYINGVKQIGYFVSTNNHIWFWRLGSFFMKIIFFYLAVYWLYPTYTERTKSTQFLRPLALTLGICMLVEYGVFFGAFQILRLEQTGNEVLEWRYSLRDAHLIPYVIMILLSYAYYATKQWLLNKEKLKLLDKTTAELALLKNQINPHFLFNILNSLFAMAIEKEADELAESITQLTGMMRYTIYENNEKYVPLEKEVAYIENYIQLQRLRFTKNEVPINFKLIGELKNARISPMLLINFVENAFKHGISLKKVSFVDIELMLVDNMLSFSVINTMHRQNDKAMDTPGGFGLKHTQKLLQLLYPGDYTLKISEANDLYQVDLEIQLEKQEEIAIF